MEGAGQEAGLTIWRIEDFAAAPYDPSLFGKFHTGDSYIVLNTRDQGGKLSWDVHYWLGDETTQDERGSAAILAVQLDDELGGAPVQHRETQDNESPLFLSYFKKGIKYLPGGVKSGFTHYDPESVEKRLFQVKGKRNIKVKQVDLDVSSLNKNDCFILDCGKGFSILVYMPEGARKMEQFKAIQVANEIRDEDHAGQSEVEVIDPFSNKGDVNTFFAELGSGSLEEVSEGSSDDAAAEEADNKEIKLYKFGEAGESGEVSGKPLRQEMLDTDVSDAFVLVTGSGIFVWVGKDSSKEERINAMNGADKFIKDNNLPSSTRVNRVVEGTETALFKQFFNVWNETDSPYQGLGRVYTPGSIAEWDIGELHAENRSKLMRSAGAAIGFMPDDGKGWKTMWRVEDMALVEVPDSSKGFLFAGDSYVIKYAYGDETAGETIVYFWQGSKSSTDEKAASAIEAARIDNDELGGKAIQVRVTQGDEPRHFLKMFGGDLVVFSGGKGSGFNNTRERDEYDEDGTRMFRVRGAGPDGVDSRAVQVAEEAASLASDDVFILETPNDTWIWCGEHSSPGELEQATRLAALVVPDKELSTIQEGGESDDFWSALGGKTEYSKGTNMDKPILSPRLFHVVILPSGASRAVEIRNFEQTDLVDDDMMILDSGAELYVWVGNDATQEERKTALELAKAYLDKDPTDRSSNNTVIITVKQGTEPTAFTCVFPSWDKDFWNN